MFKRILIAALFLVPAPGLAADNAAAPNVERGRHFRKADADGNGTLSRDEVEKSMPRLAMKFDQIDLDKDGRLSRGELKAWRKTHRSARRNAADRRAVAGGRFTHADTDGDGKISRAEAEKNAPRLARRFDAIDADKDGLLTQEELRVYREAKRSRDDKG